MACSRLCACVCVRVITPLPLQAKQNIASKRNELLGAVSADRKEEAATLLAQMSDDLGAVAQVRVCVRVCVLGIIEYGETALVEPGGCGGWHSLIRRCVGAASHQATGVRTHRPSCVYISPWCVCVRVHVCVCVCGYPQTFDIDAGRGSEQERAKLDLAYEQQTKISRAVGGCVRTCVCVCVCVRTCAHGVCVQR
jgi:hypothetical protein